ncbi:IGF-like family receptor 1 [Poecilia formosa]|uniref:IGF-like family receptor 1 n=1 Tax=Poecilia formosa TaxID=48698 RepID=A0A087XL53_POEFO|nr:PREDICTED: IGF-like family receptor 1 [Poecilia formosa]
MGYSKKCRNLTTFWDESTNRCEPCEKKAGSEVQPNCGRDDENGYHSDTHKKCNPNTFNDGSQYYCQECSACPPGTLVVKNCTSVSDTICQEIRNESTTTALPKSTTTHAATSFSTAATTHAYITTASSSSQHAAPWTVPIIVILLIIFLVAALCALMMKKRRGVCKKVFDKRRTSYQNEGFSPIQAERNSEVLCDMLNADILSAPLHKVLDDLDVLEELVILLDPDTQGIKSTKHLASHCSFPSTWITYTYSMKDTKSPLKAVLEGVTSKQPDWTVGHLAKLLRQMNRNDAISVLAKLRPTPKSFT